MSTSDELLLEFGRASRPSIFFISQSAQSAAAQRNRNTRSERTPVVDDLAAHGNAFR